MDMRSQPRRAPSDWSFTTKETLEGSVVVGFRDWVALCWPELLVSPEKKKHRGNGIAGDKCNAGERDSV
ncbi:hypothetical protein L1887_12332 [Cichorium endivia]|nr:hypothetical protein L1887_12332 [Cichorium endivia]